ncbi:hypothetical protein [Gracilimonas tropica]|uniref:hypothetical protein n=1 Tax=Gracilimonas tropica TaxID=454600 RepID=UPI0005915408|nr:hypothetical protein [Gracilimonas tropica]
MTTHQPYMNLIRSALDFMNVDAPSTSRYISYVRTVQNQIQIIEKMEKRALTVADWIKIAIELGRQALERDIGPKRIAESIYPLMDGSGQFSSYAKLSAGAATHLLLIWTGTFRSIRPEERMLLVDVIAELQKLYLNRNEVRL